jgi:hypothetical protein
VGIIVNEPILLEVELKAGGVRITGVDVAMVGGTTTVVVGGGGDTATLVGGATMLVVCASVMSFPLPSHVCSSNTPRFAKSNTVPLVASTSSHTMSTTFSTVLMPSRHDEEQRSPDAKSASVQPVNGVLYAMLHSVGRTPAAMGSRSLRETAAAVESMAAKAQRRDGCLRLGRVLAAILPAAFACPDSQLSILVKEVVIEPDSIPSHNVGPRAMCYRDEG